MGESKALALAAKDGTGFVCYSSGGGSVYLERLRPSGVRDSSSIFEFDANALLSAVSAVSKSALAHRA